MRRSFAVALVLAAAGCGRPAEKAETNVQVTQETARTTTTTTQQAAAEPVEPAAGQDAFDEVFVHYEAMRAQLADDQMDGVATHARELAVVAERQQAAFDAARTGVPAEQASSVQQLLPSIVTSARAVAGAGDIKGAREAFWSLSQPLIEWRKLRAAGPRISYCPHADKSWLQPDGPISNPYYGHEMLRCGNFTL